MTICCKFHPNQPAYFSCPRCGISFCGACTVVRSRDGFAGAEKLRLCPSCHLPAEWLGVSNVVEPFWKRLHKFFLYPFGLFPLCLMLILASAAVVFREMGIIGALVVAFAWAVRIKYSFEALKKTAGGELRPPTLSGELITRDFGPVVKQIILFVILGAASVFVAATAGLFALGVFAVFLVLLFPSMLILLVTTNSLRSAVNPFLFVPLALRIGWGYLLMYFFLILLNGAPTALFYAIIQYLPEQSHFFLFSMGETYYSIISYHLMGYVLLQYSEDIGYRVELDDFHTGEGTSLASPEISAEDQIMTQVAPLIREGRLDDAIDQIDIAVRSGRANASLIRERYFKLIKTANRPQKMLEEGEIYIDQLVGENKMLTAANVYADLVGVKPDFSAEPSIMLQLGAWFNENDRPTDALGAYNRLIKAHPGSHEVARAYFQAAQTLHLGLRKTEKAKKILGAMLKKYPNDPAAPMARQFLERLESY
jgi:tetratricopeptide (TPR) repeat protein